MSLRGARQTAFWVEIYPLDRDLLSSAGRPTVNESCRTCRKTEAPRAGLATDFGPNEANRYGVGMGVRGALQRVTTRMAWGGATQAGVLRSRSAGRTEMNK